MRCDWQNDPTAPSPCHVVDLDTGEVLSPCAMADDLTGEYVRYIQPFQVDPCTGLARVYKGVSRIEIREGLPPK